MVPFKIHIVKVFFVMDEALKTSIFSLYPIHLHTILVFLLQTVSTISVTYFGHVLLFLLNFTEEAHANEFYLCIFKRISDFHAVHIAYMKLNKKL